MMRTIVMTGGSSGFGDVARSRIGKHPETQVLVGARGSSTLPLELAELNSVRAFAAEVTRRVGGTGIDALVLNAGLSFRTGSHRTVDGFESTFAVNHLAHYLLLRLLMPQLSADAIVVLTTSGTHDPDHKTFLPMPPRHADAQLLARPDDDPQRDASPRAAGGRAYTSSKLCNVLTVRAVTERSTAMGTRWRTVAFDPGPTPGTGLLRDTPPAIRLVWRLIGALPRLPSRFNSRETVGQHLADLVLGKVVPPAGQYYARVVGNRLTWTTPSKLAQSDDARDALWNDSAELTGLR